MSDDRPIGETIEEKIRELGEDIRALRCDFDEFKRSFLCLMVKNEEVIQQGEELIKRNNECLKKST